MRGRLIALPHLRYDVEDLAVKGLVGDRCDAAGEIEHRSLRDPGVLEYNYPRPVDLSESLVQRRVILQVFPRVHLGG